MFETWAPIPGYEGRWEASTEGRVRSFPRQGTRGIILRQRTNKRGYLSLVLGRETHEVHRLVALAFLGPRPAGHQVRHVDGDRMNCRVSNLVYGTPSENQRDKRSHGTDWNVKKTHCSKGHAFTPENIRRIPSRPNARYCRTCEMLRGKGPKGRTVPDFRAEWAL